MTATIPLLLVLGLISILVVYAVNRKRGQRGKKGQATYGGPIRFTDKNGRDMKIIQKDDGSFEIVEESKDK